jgi:hypothetical protein
MRAYTISPQQLPLAYRVLAQVHRWYQFYERAVNQVDNQLDLLSEQIHVKSASEESTGHQAYRERVTKLTPHWQNAHHIQQFTLQERNQILLLDLNIIYQNIGYLADGKLMNAAVNYQMQLTQNNSLFLPKFVDIQLQARDSAIPAVYAEFIDAYPQNRICSLIYYFAALMDSHLPDATPFQEIFSSTVDIQLSSAHCRNFEEFNSWYQSKPAQMLKSQHVLENLAIEALDHNSYQATFEFAWTGIHKNKPGVTIQARTRHQWRVLDNPQDRFAQIQTIAVTALQAPAPVAETA